MSKEVKAAWIGGICVIIAAIIGVFSININIENVKLKKNNMNMETENAKLKEENSDWKSEYNDLQEDFKELYERNTSLSIEVDTLKNSMEQYASLADENALLKSQISTFETEIESLKELDTQKITEESNAPADTTSNSNRKKVSIFDLDTFKGNGYWYDLSYLTFSEEDFVDTYDNKYLNAHIGYHSATDKSRPFTPTYLLDKKYNTCEGEIAWSKVYKDHEGSAWIEFYSGDECLYTTEAITADSRLLSFSFSVEGIEKLTIVRNGTSSSNAVEIIYPYLNLVE